MLDAHYLKTVLEILKTHRVRHIKMNGLELEFHMEQTGGAIESTSSIESIGTVDPHSHSEHQPDSTALIAETIKKQEESLPPDLRADNLMNQDNILNWSSPDQPQEQPAMPLTGEAPL